MSDAGALITSLPLREDLEASAPGAAYRHPAATIGSFLRPPRLCLPETRSCRNDSGFRSGRLDGDLRRLRTRLQPPLPRERACSTNLSLRPKSVSDWLRAVSRASNPTVQVPVGRLLRRQRPVGTQGHRSVERRVPAPSLRGSCTAGWTPHHPSGCSGHPDDRVVRDLMADARFTAAVEGGDSGGNVAALSAIRSGPPPVAPRRPPSPQSLRLRFVPTA